MAYHTIDLAGLRTRLKERWDGVPFWTDAEADDAINEALHHWNLLTGIWKGRIVISTTATTGPWIALPASVTLGLHVEYNGRGMASTDVASLDAAYPNWESETTASGGSVPTASQLWAPAGMYQIAVWPADGVGGNSYVVDGIAQTPVLRRDADYLDLSEDEAEVILGYALHVTSFSQGAGVVHATADYLNQFYRAAALRNGRLAASNLYKTIETMDFRRLTHPDHVYGNNGPANPVVVATQGE